MLDCEVLIVEGPPVYGFTSGAIRINEIATLYHKVLDDTMKDNALNVNA